LGRVEEECEWERKQRCEILGDLRLSAQR
jgi:hypothetical protein